MKHILITLILITLLGSCTSAANETDTATKYGSLSVPENRNDPSSRLIRLSYAVVRAKIRSDRPPIVFIQGGPGGSSLAMVSFFENNPLSEKQDVILFDARGTGRSGAFCEEAGGDFIRLMAKDLSVEEEYQETLAICEACKEEIAETEADLAGYNSLENAADLEALREHLKVDKWVLFGGSYGTRLGLTYLREYEDAAEAAIFMGLFPPEINIYEGFLSGLNGALEHLFASCLNDPDCKEKYPDLETSFHAMMDNLKEKPLSVRYKSSEFVINPQDALLLIHQMLYQRQTIQEVPSFITALKDGKKGSVITSSINRTEQTFAFINAATYWSVQANEEVQFNEANIIQKQLPAFNHLMPGPAFFINDQQILDNWHEFRSSEIENEAVLTATPILIVNGMFDPITPMENARKVLEYLPNASLAEFPNDGHTIFNPCFFDLVESFVANEYKAPKASCVVDGTLNWR
ncbi:MAG: alpha/beta fold hydrolase [Cyclobacteriaceae bacterium]